MATTNEISLATELRPPSRTRVCKLCRYATSDSKAFLQHQMYAHDNNDFSRLNDDGNSTPNSNSSSEESDTQSLEIDDEAIDNRDDLNGGGNINEVDSKINGGHDSENEDPEEDKCIFHRNYTCIACDLSTTNAKMYLHHLNDVHGHTSVIHECKKCTYATRYKQKLHRHAAAHARRESYEPEQPSNNPKDTGVKPSCNLPSPDSQENIGNNGTDDDVIPENKSASQSEAPLNEKQGDHDKTTEKEAVGNGSDANMSPVLPDGTDQVEDLNNHIESKKVCDVNMKENVAADSEWADNNRLEDDDLRKVISVPTHTIPPLDESDSDDEGALVIAEDEPGRRLSMSDFASSTPGLAQGSPRSVESEQGEAVAKRRRPPRQEIDPNKYKEILDEEGKTKFACTACGSAYTWKKSLSKHWKEKHDDSKSGSPIASPGLQTHLKSTPTNPILGSQIAARLTHERMMKNASPVSYPTLNIPSYVKPRPLTPQGQRSLIPNGLTSPFINSNVKNEQMYKEPSRAEGEVFGNPYLEVLQQKSKAVFRMYPSLDQPIDLTVKKEPEDSKLPSATQNVTDAPLDFSLVKKMTDHKFDSDGFPESSASLQCSKCGQVSTDMEEFTRHMENHLTKRGHNCAECRTKFKTSEDLNRHFSEVHRDKILGSSHIAFSMDRQAQHTILEATQGDNSLCCTQCDFVAKWPTELQKHVMVHSSERPYICMVCNSDYKWKWDLVKHFDKSHHSLPNPYRKREYSPHYKTYGPSESPEPPRKRKPSEVKHAIADEDPPFMCSVCGFHCRYHVQMVLHMRQMHQREVTEAKSDSSPNDAGNSFTDKMPTGTEGHDQKETELKISIPRQRQFDSDEEMEMDLADMEMPLSSPGTHASASVRESLKQHINHMKLLPRMDTTTNDKLSSADILLPYKCSLCEYRARWPSEITQHMKNHSDEKPFLCPRCSYKSKWKWDVVKHLKRCGGGTIKDVIDTTRHRMPKYQRTSLPKSLPTKPVFLDVHSMQNPTSLSGSIPMAHSGNNTSTPYFSAAPTNAAKIPESKAIMQTKLQPAHTSAGSASPVGDSAPPAHCSTSDASRTAFQQSLGLMPVNRKVPQPSSMPVSVPQSPEDYIRVNPILTSGGNIVKSSSNTVGDGYNCESMYGQPPVATSALLSQLEGIKRPKGKPVQGIINEGLHHCLNCAFVASSPAELKRHVILHSEEKPFHCDSCDYQTKWKCDLKKHVQAYGHNTATVFTARSKLAKFNDTLSPTSQVGLQQNIGQQMTLVTGKATAQMDGDVKLSLLKCDSCDYTTHKRHLLESHQKIHEKRGQSQSNKYKCKQCNFTANDLPSFLQHKVEHSNQQALRAATETPTGSGISNMETSSSPKHAKHLRKPTKLFCNLCPYICVDPDRLLYHKDRHLNLGPFMCNFCSFSVKDREELDNHMRIHPEFTRKHVPSPGGASPQFDNSMLNLAEGYHTTRKGNRKLYQCKKCPYSNESHGNIARHVEKHGNYSKYKCPKCDYSLDRLNLLLQHTRGVHGIHDADKVWLNYSNLMQSVSKLKENQRNGHKTPTVSVDRSPQLEVQKEYQMSENPQKKTVRGGAMQVVFRGVKHKMYKCPKCPFKSKKESSCLSHINMHGTSGGFMCSHCDYSANKMERVKRHMESIHGDADALVLINKPQATTKSPHSFLEKERLYDNESLNGNSVYASMPKLSPKPHVVEIVSNSDLLPPEITDSDDSPDGGMSTPIRQMMSPVFQSKPRRSPMSGSPKLRRCDLCPYAVKGRLPFERHMECHNKVGRYTCKHCNYSLDRLNLLYQHMQLHGDMSRDIPSKNKITIKEFNRNKVPKENFQSFKEDLKFMSFVRPNTDQLKEVYANPAESDDSQDNSLVIDTDDKNQSSANKDSFESSNQSSSVFPEREVVAEVSSYNSAQDPSFQQEAGETQETVPSLVKTSESPMPHNPTSVDITPAVSEKEDEFESAMDTLSCPECPFIAETDEECEKHYGFHVNKFKYQCDHCTFSHDRVNILYQHRKLHSDMADFIPSPAPFKLETKNDNLEQTPVDDKNKVEKQETNGELSNASPAAKKLTLTINKVNENSWLDSKKNDDAIQSKTASKKVALLCRHCPFKAKTKSDLVTHEMLHVQRSKFNCDFCTYSVFRQNLLQNHMKLHQSKGANDDQSSALNKEKDVVAEEDEDDSASNASSEVSGSRRSSRSGIRGRSFVQFSCALKHKATVKSGYEQSLQSTSTMYGCDECPYFSNNKANYQNHSERHKKKSKFQCPFCTYSTNRQNQCLNHTRLHFPSDEDFDVQDVTSKLLEASGMPDASAAVSDDKHELKTGTKSVTNSLKCKYCSRPFVNKASLQKHEEQHTAGCSPTS